MAADALCRTAVTAAPSSMPTRGWEKVVSRERKAGLSLSGETAPLIDCRPYIKTVKPRRISPPCFCVGRLAVMRSRMPTTAKTAAIVEVDSRDAQPLSPPR